MESDKKLQVLEDELKVMKAEVKTVLSEVYDFLLNTNFEETRDKPREPEFDQTSLIVNENRTPQARAVDDSSKSENGASSQSETAKADALTHKSEEMTGMQKDMQKDMQKNVQKNVAQATNVAAAQAGMLANLIGWVAVAKREMGQTQLTEFLDVYSCVAQLSPYLKQLILRLASVIEDPVGPLGPATKEELTMLLDRYIGNSNAPADCKQNLLSLLIGVIKRTESASTIRSRLVLELHGILAGASVPLRALDSRPPDDGKSETAAPKLKIVLPRDTGKEQEYTFDLAPSSR